MLTATTDTQLASGTLVLVPGWNAGSEQIPLQNGRAAIGSADGNTLVVQANGVAPRHCLLIVDNGRVLLKAWSGQTAVNDNPVQEAFLMPGDRLTVGTAEFQLRRVDDGAAAAGNSEDGFQSISDRIESLTELVDQLDGELAGHEQQIDQLDGILGDIDTCLGQETQGEAASESNNVLAGFEYGNPSPTESESTGGVGSGIDAERLDELADSIEFQRGSDETLVLDDELQTRLRSQLATIDRLSRSLMSRATVLAGQAAAIAAREAGSSVGDAGLVAGASVAVIGDSAVADIAVPSITDSAPQATLEQVTVTGIEGEKRKLRQFMEGMEQGTSCFDREQTDEESESEGPGQSLAPTMIEHQNAAIENSLRSRDDAVRQLDALVLAATEATDTNPESSTLNPDDTSHTGGSSTGQGLSAGSGATVDCDDVEASFEDPRNEANDISPASDDAGTDNGSVCGAGPETESDVDPTSPELDESTAETSTFANATDETIAESPDGIANEPVEGSSYFDSVFGSTGGGNSSDEEADTVGGGVEPEVGASQSGSLGSPSETLATESSGSSFVSSLMNEDDSHWSITGLGETASDDSDCGSSDGSTVDPATQSDDAVQSLRSQLAEMFDMPGLDSAESTFVPNEENPQADDEPDESASGCDGVTKLPGPAWNNPDSLLADEDSHAAASSLSVGDEASVSGNSNRLTAPTGLTSIPQSSAVDDLDEAADSTADATDSCSIDKDLTETTTDCDVDDPDSVSAYMQQLLARNRLATGRPEEEAPAGETESYAASSSVVSLADRRSDSDATSEAEGSDDSASELAGTRRTSFRKPPVAEDAARIRERMQTLRDVANESARSAVVHANRKQLKAEVLTLMIATLIGLGFGVTALALQLSIWIGLAGIAVGCLFALQMGYKCLRTWRLSVRPTTGSGEESRESDALLSGGADTETNSAVDGTPG